MDEDLQKAPCLSCYYPVSMFLAYYLFYILSIHQICALCGIFSAISVVLTTENSDDFEIRVPDASRSLKITPVNSLCVISY